MDASRPGGRHLFREMLSACLGFLRPTTLLQVGRLMSSRRPWGSQRHRSRGGQIEESWVSTRPQDTYRPPPLGGCPKSHRVYWDGAGTRQPARIFSGAKGRQRVTQTKPSTNESGAAFAWPPSGAHGQGGRCQVRPARPGRLGCALSRVPLPGAGAAREPAGLRLPPVPGPASVMGRGGRWASTGWPDLVMSWPGLTRVRVGPLRVRGQVTLEAGCGAVSTRRGGGRQEEPLSLQKGCWWGPCRLPLPGGKASGFSPEAPRSRCLVVFDLSAGPKSGWVPLGSK